MSPIDYAVLAVLAAVLIFAAYKYLKAHPNAVSDFEARIAALEGKQTPAAPAILTGDHLVQVVRAQGDAMAQVAQAVATAPAAPSPFAGYGVGAFSTGATTYNPDNYTQDTRYPAYLAAGRPVKDVLGRGLDTQGALLDGPYVANKDPSKGMWGADVSKGGTATSDSFSGDGSTRTVVFNDPGNSLGVAYLLNGAALKNGESVILTAGGSFSVVASYDGSNPHHPDVARTGIWLRK